MHPKNHLKLTGDTHPPDVGYEWLEPDLRSDDAPQEHSGTLRLEEEVMVAAAVPEATAPRESRADGARPSGGWRDRVRARPVKAALLALGLGLLVAKLVR